MLKRKPTRRDFMVIINRIQGKVGRAISAIVDDRNPNGFEVGCKELNEIHNLCIESLSYESQINESGPWSTDS